MKVDLEIRQLFPGFRYVVIDHGLKHPLIGVAATNGRVFWGKKRAEQFAVYYQEKYGDPGQHEVAPPSHPEA